jgi:hypothetical protein
VKRNSLACAIALCVASACTADDARMIFISPAGDDSNPGTRDKPLATIQQAAARLKPGDTCILRGGTYRQSALLKDLRGTADKPIRFVAAQGEKVVLDGTEPVAGPWDVYAGKTYKTALKTDQVEQLFVDGRMQVEARQPNATFEQRWDRSRWADSAKGSRKDMLICPALGKTGIDWTGAIAVLNVAHQFKTWTRPVLKHGKGADRFTYALDERLSDGADEGPSWWDDKFYLTGKLEALDAPTEWFHDVSTGTLYLQTDDGASPAGRTVAYKQRTYAMDLSGCRHVQIVGLDFFATTFRLAGCDNCLIDSCRLRFPTYSRLLTEMDPAGTRRPSPATRVEGNNNVVRRVSLAYSNTHGLVVSGGGNLVENSLVRDVNWVGAIPYAGIAAFTPADAAAGNRVSHCTVAKVGNIGILYRGPNNVIEYNHVHHTGLACKDIAAVHTGSPACAGSVAHHNWIHDSTGKGLRGDDQTRGLTFHHNVVWNCADAGIIIKGDHNRVYHNTLIGRQGSGTMILPTRPEPQKWWAKHEFLKVQNPNSLIVNNALVAVQWRYKPLPDLKNITHNMKFPNQNAAAWLVDPGKLDFRPKAGSPLIDAGRTEKGLNDTGVVGKAPDIGAYESGEEPWVPGADWKEEE